MTIKRVIGIVAVAVAALAVGWFLFVGFYPHRRPVSQARLMIGPSKMIAASLQDYYSALTPTSQEVTTSEVVQFLVNDRNNRLSSHFTSDLPPQLRLGPCDFGAYLFLPSELHSDAPLLISCTTPLNGGRNKTDRIAMFLNGENITVVSVPAGVIEQIVGEDIESEPPDFYFTMASLPTEAAKNLAPDQKTPD